ncbi:MAG: hypothetical protein ACRCWW_12305 [Scandinavium sp.]|uniref:hypothetical protein n=1 Tax=Scandinavium sp. TaxID=2830653 RepID=UPI003F2EB9E7
MCEIMDRTDLEQRMSDLANQSSAWFRRHQHIDMPMNFVRYVAESQSGCLKKQYACLLDDSLECLISILPVIANRLAVEIGQAIAVPQQQIRPALGLIIYWLILAHTDKKSAMPDREQMFDILSGILSVRFLALKKM